MLGHAFEWTPVLEDSKEVWRFIISASTILAVAS